MVMFDFMCPRCKNEIKDKIVSSQETIKCKRCGDTMSKQFINRKLEIIFKGNGWYSKDNNKNKI